MPKILVIDDDPDFRYAVRMVLEAEGFEAEMAADGEEGIAKVLDTQPDLVTLDVIMGEDLEGFEVARTLREEHDLVDLPILMLTAVHSVKQVPYRFAPDKEYLPVDVFMDKPILPETIVETIKEMLGQRREEPEYPL
ncbi:MAG: response regulator [Anaerolineae bacterium]|jgi:CheY-like chemotaxis protein